MHEMYFFILCSLRSNTPTYTMEYHIQRDQVQHGKFNPN